MKKVINRSLAILLACLLVLGGAPIEALSGLNWHWPNLDFSKLSGLFEIKANAAATSGTCGENLTWNYDESTCTLTISGTGAMRDYDITNGPKAPWNSYGQSMLNVVIEDGVTSIGNDAFYQCKFTNISIPDSVLSIGRRAFEGCSEIAGSITIPNAVTDIGEYAFYGCIKITSIEISDGVKRIGTNAFYSCINLVSITIPDSVELIGRNTLYGTAFYKDSSNWVNGSLYVGVHLIEVKSPPYTIRQGTKCVAGEAFVRNTSITSITIPNGVVSLGHGAFNGCNNLTRVTLPQSLKIIDDGVFYSCTKLTSINIPDGITSIGGTAFYNCSSLSNIHIPDSVISLGEEVVNKTAFYNDETNWENGVLYLDNHLVATDTSVAGRYTVRVGVRCVAGRSFYNCREITSVVLPASVVYIGGSAFVNCFELTDVYYYGTESGWNNVKEEADSRQFANASKHYYMEIGEEPASCTKDGLSSYSYWSNTDPIEYIVEPTVLGRTGHISSQAVIENSIAETCSTDGQYDSVVYCSACGAEISRDTIPVPATRQHIANPPVNENEVSATCGADGQYDSVIYCSVCGEEISRQTIIVPATNQHVPSAVVTENETDATCAAAGRYDSVVYCSACGLELSRETIAVSATGQHIADSPVNENEIGATCGTDGQYESVIYCSVCGVELSRQTVLVPAINQHTPSTAVTENEISATCTQAGYYDSVVYCSVCLAELNREVITVPATGHTANSTVRENEIAATCAAAGRYDSVVYCSACGAELSRDTITVPATDQHTPGTAVTENEVAATCTQTGHYDSVVYCAICNQELVRETIITPVTAHSFSSYTSNGDATCTQDGTKTAKCNNCEATNTVIDEGTALGHNFVNYVSNNNATLIQDGTKTAKCERCDAEDTVPDRGTAILTYVIRNDAVEITKCKQSFAGTMEIPEMINGYPVTTIGEEAFYNCTGMTGVTLPNSVRTIGVSAFSHCTALASIAIPNGVTSIEDYAFSDCNSVASITIADSVQSIGRNVFSNCTEWYAGLENGPVVVDGYLLDYKGSMPENTELSFNAVRMIATNALKNQSNLKRAVFGDTLERVSKGAFSGCFGLEEIELSDHVEYIHDDAFSGGDTLTVIGYYNEYVEAFANSNSFVYSPYTVTLTFNPTQGQMDSGTITVIAKKPLGDMSLPEPSCSELAFGGWYADEECIAMISGESVFEEDTTLYASWLSASSIAVKTMPERTQYVVGDYLDTIGLVLSASFSNGETKDISAGFTCTPNHLTRQGKYRIKVVFGGECAYFYVNVNESANVTVSVETLPNKTTYNTNEAFDPTGLVILLDYGNGITNRITKGLSFEYDFSTPGTKCVTINYSAGNSVLTTEIAVEVTEPVNEVYADNVSITNKIVSFPVRISQNSGLMGFSISLAYDEEVLEPISVVPNAALGGYMNDSIASSTSDSFSVVWFGTDVFAEDGVLFTAAFRLKTSDAVNTEIGLSYSERDTFDGDYNDVLLACRRILIPADATEAAIIFANDLNAGSGETVSIPVYVSNPSGLTQATVTFSYDHTAFSYVGVSSDCGTVAATNGNKLVIRWDGSIPEDGGIFTIQMQSAANMIGKYPFIVNCISSAFNDSGTVECSDFAVSVRNQTAARVYCETPTFVPGEDISVNICIEDNPGMMGCTLFVTFDSSVLTFKSVSRKSVIRSGSFDYSIDNGTLKLVWNSTDDVIDDGAMYELVFGTVDDDSYDSTDITLSFEENDTFNANWDPVMFSCESGTLRTHNDATVTAISVKSLPAKTTYRVGDSLETTGLSLTVTKNDGTTETVTSGFTCTPTVLTGVGSQVITVTYQDQATTFTVNVYDDVLPGDANADETVDLKDVVILQRYLAGGWNVSVSGSNADVNKDGEVNVKDVVLLSRYLAGGWNVTLI